VGEDEGMSTHADLTPRSAHPGRRAGYWLLDHPWVAILAVGTAVFVLWAAGTRKSEHEVKAVFTEAVSMYPGLGVRMAGIDAGKIHKVEHENGHAVLTLGIDDDVWPLREGTLAKMRFGTTVGNATRYVELVPGPDSARELREGGVITNDKTVESVEFDDVFDVFDAKTRKHVQGTTEGMAKTFGPRAGELADAIKETGPGLDSIGGLASELVRDEPALVSMIGTSHRVTRELAARQGQIRDLVTHTAATLDTFAGNTQGVARSLDRLAPALSETRTTLARLDGSIGGLDELVADLAPGARALAPLAGDVTPALTALRRTVPAAVSAFRTARSAAPRVTELLQQARPFSAAAAPVLEKLAPMVGCLRPYAPEIAGLMSTWLSWSKGYDPDGTIGRVWANFGDIPTSATPVIDSEDKEKLTGQGYALVRPPGYNAGKPWFMPECGAGVDGITASKDPESQKRSEP